MPPVCLYTPYVWIPWICLDAPICFDTPCICFNVSCMFGYCHIFGHPHMFGCLPVCLDACCNIQDKESMLCQTKGASICPYTFVCPICLDAPHMFGCTHCMFGCLHMFGLLPVCLDALNMFECPCMF